MDIIEFKQFKRHKFKLPLELYGGIAQLGERLNGIQEVMGSEPSAVESPVYKVLVRGQNLLNCW